MKKRKLNSKNPKYNTSKKEELVIIKKIPLKGKAKGNLIWYEKQK